ncbi:MAG: hypothetical protein Q8O24_02975 [Gallionellaceae bacterium]|nr:hypothetical protein [Gallionellaceae bacterium]
MKNIYKTEPEYRKEIRESALSNDFAIKPEQWIKWPINDEMIRVDFILEPKQHLIDVGFDATKIAIEVKSPIKKESVKQLLDCMSQAHSYTLCTHENEFIDFIVIYPAIQLFFDYDFEHKYKLDQRSKYHRSEVSILHRVMQRANIGSLEITNESYRFSFAGSRFYSPEKGRSKIKNLGMVRRIGSRKKLIK